MENKKVTFDNLDVYLLLVKICGKYKGDPQADSEAETFFQKLLEQYDGEYDLNKLRKWLDNKISKLFVYLMYPPRWIQGYQWPFSSGKPTIFMGQIDIPFNQEKPHFHDFTSLYVFQDTVTKALITVMQQF